MENKAKQLLGLEDTKPQRKTIRGSVMKTTLYVQKKGYLSKKPFSSNKSVVKHQKWQKRWFVLKDSFLIWYKSKPAKGDFGVHPAGVLPLGGCGVFPQGRSNDGFEFELTHPDFNEASLLLRSPDEEDANDWIRWLGLCKEATWENAMLGDAQMMSLKTKDTRTEREASEALERARKNAEEIRKKRLERQNMMEEHEKRQMAQRARLRATRVNLKKLQQEQESNMDKMANKKKKKMEELEEKKRIEQQLFGAKDALLKLEGLLAKQRGEKKEALQADIKKLKDFIEANLAEAKKDEIMSVRSFERDDSDEDSIV